MRKKSRVLILTALLLMFWVIPVHAEVYIQCPCLLLDANGKPDPTQFNPAYGTFYNVATQNIECTIPGAPPRNIACKALTAGDGRVIMGNGEEIYVFGFDDVTGIPTKQVMNMVNDPVAPGGMRGAETTAPAIIMQGGGEFYLSLTNVGMVERPDLTDSHTVHYHGFPNAGSVFDGEPMASIAIHMGETLTYYYNNVEPGTYIYHCHVEASEHMQMGMLGNLYVRSAQDGTTVGTCASKLYAYNDGDGSTCYDVGYPLEITAFDPEFHHADNTYNEVDFAFMTDTYTLFNGRGYPDTINPCGRQTAYSTVPAGWPACGPNDPILNSLGVPSQNTPALIMAKAGQKILLHLPSLATVDFYTVTVLGLPMTIIGQGARQYKSVNGTYYYNTGSITLGGGEGYDVLIDTTGKSPGTYFIYTTKLNYLSNDDEDFGGMMTEIVLTP